MLELRDVNTSYGDSHVLRGVTLRAAAGQVVCVLGRNGTGKTTTVRSIVGLTPPSSGSILFEGRELVGMAPHLIARQGIGYVPQGRRIFRSLTAEANLSVAFRGESLAARLDYVYGLFPELREVAGRGASLLSGGQQQMLVVGRALMSSPSLLVMDEPTEGLAPVIIKRLGRAVREMSESGVTVVVVEQNVAFGTSIADWIYVMGRGAMVYSGSVPDFRANQEVQSRYVGVQTGTDDAA